MSGQINRVKIIYQNVFVYAKILSMETDEKDLNRLKLHSKKFASWLKGHLILITMLFCAIIIVSGTSFLIARYSSVAAPGANLAGENISGENAVQIRQSISKIESKIQLTFSYQGKTVVAQASDLGIQVNINKTASNALATSNNWLNRLNVFSNQNVALIATYNWDQTAKFLNQAFPLLITDTAQNAGVVYDQNSQQFITQASADGKIIDMDKTKAIIKGLVAHPRNAVADVAITTSKPSVGDEAAQLAANYANERLKLRINFQLNGKTIYYPDPVDIASFTTFTNHNGQLNVVFDPAKAKKFITTSIQNSIPNKPVNGQEIVSADNSTVLKVIAAGQDGQSINNLDQLTDEMLNALTDNQATNLTLQTTTAPATMTKTVAPNNHWIEADLSNFIVTAYDGTKPVWTDTNISDGGGLGSGPYNPERATITGLFTVFEQTGGNDPDNSSMAMDASAGVNNSNQYGGVCMPNPGGTVAQLCSIHYVTYWGPGGYAFHEAWWLTNGDISATKAAGYGISHGCINMYKDDAKFIYGFSQIGTPVWVHK